MSLMQLMLLLSKSEKPYVVRIRIVLTVISPISLNWCIVICVHLVAATIQQFSYILSDVTRAGMLVMSCNCFFPLHFSVDKYQ